MSGSFLIAFSLWGAAMKHTLLGATALALIGAMPATAADMPVKAPIVRAPVVQPFTWEGFYWGVHCGAAWGKSHIVVDNDRVETKPTGGFCGGQVGYNWHRQNWLVGLEGDLGYFLLKDSNTLVGDPNEPLTNEVQIGTVKYRWYATFTGRLGITQDRWLVYVKGGGAVANIKNTWTEFEGDPLTLNQSFQVTKTKFGWTVGGGVEYATSRLWSWKIEYLYMDFGTKHTFFFDDTVEYKNRVHTVKLGVNRRWGVGD
jgi:outer membrane immunogenic protein